MWRDFFVAAQVTKLKKRTNYKQKRFDRSRCDIQSMIIFTLYYKYEEPHGILNKTHVAMSLRFIDSL
jgi:hypothetical protein